jgi:RNA polymerase sigma factor (sigma-70 family)
VRARRIIRVTVLAFSLPARPAVPMRLRREHAHLSDEALVALVVRSDDAALAELYDRYGRVAFGLAHRVLRDRALAEDAVQEAFLGLWRGASRFIPERAHARTWILTLVHRRAVDLVRREERRRTEAYDPAAEQAAPDLTDEAAWVSLERGRVQEALAQLPDRQREALELAYYGGFTQSELAERLGEPLGTIKSRMFNGLARLRDLLQDVVPEEDEWDKTRSTS